MESAVESEVKMIKLLRSLVALNQAVEVLVVDLIASWAPWLAPIVPAYMTYYTMSTNLEFPLWAALAGSLAVECLGLATIQTSVMFWDWNAKARKLDPRAPLWAAIVMAIFYLAIVILANAILDQTGWERIVVKALLTSMSVPAGMTIALRAGHARRVQQVVEDTADRRASRQHVIQVLQHELPELSGNFRKLPETSTESVVAATWRELSDDQKRSLVGKSTRQIMGLYPGLSERTAFNWAQRARQYEEVKSE